jgi:L,D-transpeptidase catalytic domain
MKGVPVRSRSSRCQAIAVAVVVLGVSFFSSNAGAQDAEWMPPRTVWVDEAGHTIDGYFLDLWRERPELLGLPISEEWEQPTEVKGRPRADRIVQYFERLAIVYVPEDERLVWQVQALPLGTEALKRDKKSLAEYKLPEKGTCDGMATYDCRLFPESHHTAKAGFLNFWEQNDGERLLGSPLTEEFVARNGYTTQYFENAVLQWVNGSEVTLRAIGVESAKALKLPVDRINQPVGVPIYDETIFIPPVIEPADDGVLGGGIGALSYGPGPQQRAWKEIVVSIGRQTLWAYEDGQLVTETLVSTGTAEIPETTTPIGDYSVLTKYVTDTMDGTINDEDYLVPDVPWVMYFDNQGNALHGTYWHNNFGTPMSHGCINLPLDIAEFLFSWAPEGTAVSIIA